MRERAHRAFLDTGDAAGAARTAIWLAADELDFHGAAAVAEGWLQRARRLLEPLDDRGEHGWLAFHEGYAAHAAGDTQTARALGLRAAGLGRRLGVPDLEMLGLALEGASLVACAEVEPGMRRLGEATTVALEGRAEIPISGAWTFCLLVSACMAVADLGRASAWCDRIERFAERYSSRYMLAFCRAEYGALHVARGRWGEADAVLQEAVEDFGRSRPAWAGGPLVALAELRRRQGRPADAEALLERAGSGTGARLCRARLALDRGQAERAADEVERALRQLPAERRLQRAPALELLALASSAAGRLDRAADALEELRATGAATGAATLEAGIARAEGALLAARGDHDRARVRLEDAVDAYERAGFPYGAALARAELAASLAALDHEQAGAEAARAAERLAALGAAPGSDALGDLTAREREVLGLVAEGLTNRQIAERLVLSEHTVHRHVTNLLRKLGLPSRAAAAARAARAGLSG
jgi:DNA-binding NarL/FixJ family response regulator